MLLYGKILQIIIIVHIPGYGKMVSMDGFEGVSTYILRENNSSQEKYYRQFVEWYSAADWDSVDW